MKLGKKIVVGAVLLLLLSAGMLGGLGASGSSHGGSIPVAMADGCDSVPPPPGLDCPPEPTPTPTPPK